MTVPVDEFRRGLFSTDTVDIRPEWGWNDAEAIPSGCANTESADWDKLRMSWTLISPLKLRVRLRWSAYVIYTISYDHGAHQADVTCLLSPKVTPTLATPFLLRWRVSCLRVRLINREDQLSMKEQTSVDIVGDQIVALSHPLVHSSTDFPIQAP